MAETKAVVVYATAEPFVKMLYKFIGRRCLRRKGMLLVKPLQNNFA